MNINGRTKVLGIFGNPVKHTLSPDIHNYLGKKLGINSCYVPFPVDDIKKAVEGAYSMGVSGLNVTVPFKESVIPYLSEIDPDAKNIGAVNTLVRTENGFKGYNTDMPGLLRALSVNGVSLKDKNVIILGAGGAARAALYMAVKEGASLVFLINRTLEKAVSLADEINKIFDKNVIKPVKADNISVIPKERYIMIQCTSLGLKKEDGLLIEDDSSYEMADYGYDLIYNPAITPFIEKMMEHAVPCDNGLKMLLYQGIIAYELWNDINVSSDLSDAVYNNLCKKLYGDNIILTGYMGSGKSAVGKKISVLYGMDFIDTDEYIVEKEGMSINEIFERFGEDTFRKMETEALRELSVKCYNTVIATGGGIVLRKENVNILKDTGKIYYLMASPEEIYNRIQYDTTRPLLKSGSSDEVKEKIKTMMEQRRAYYDMSCDIKIETDGKTPEEIAELVYSAL